MTGTAARPRQSVMLRGRRKLADPGEVVGDEDFGKGLGIGFGFLVGVILLIALIAYLIYRFCYKKEKCPICKRRQEEEQPSEAPSELPRNPSLRLDHLPIQHSNPIRRGKESDPSLAENGADGGEVELTKLEQADGWYSNPLRDPTRRTSQVAALAFASRRGSSRPGAMEDASSTLLRGRRGTQLPAVPSAEEEAANGSPSATSPDPDEAGGEAGRGEPMVAELPPGWYQFADADGDIYFWHRPSNTTTWERPTEDTETNGPEEA